MVVLLDMDMDRTLTLGQGQGQGQDLGAGPGAGPGDIRPQELANLLWACAKVNYASRHLLQVLGGGAGQNSGDLL